MALFIIRYGEIGLKSKSVRRRFENALKKNIAAKFIREKRECRIELDWGRVYLWSDDIEEAAEILKKTFGIVSFSRATECSSSKEEICNLAAEMSKPLFKKGMSFRVKARRTGQHEYTSMELAKDAGSAVWVANEDLGPSVDLKNPDLTVYVEVRQNRAYLFTEKIPGPGGMPVATQGRILGLANDEKGMAACWLMMKRGCKVLVSTQNQELMTIMENWDPRLKVIEEVNFSEMESLAFRIRAEGIALGWDLADFEMHKNEIEGMALPVFYPIIALSPSKLEELIKQIKS